MRVCDCSGDGASARTAKAMAITPIGEFGIEIR
jgi:hypothetical protein